MKVRGRLCHYLDGHNGGDSSSSRHIASTEERTSKEVACRSVFTKSDDMSAWFRAEHARARDRSVTTMKMPVQQLCRLNGRCAKIGEELSLNETDVVAAASRARPSLPGQDLHCSPRPSTWRKRRADMLFRERHAAAGQGPCTLSPLEGPLRGR